MKLLEQHEFLQKMKLDKKMFHYKEVWTWTDTKIRWIYKEYNPRENIVVGYMLIRVRGEGFYLCNFEKRNIQEFYYGIEYFKVTDKEIVDALFNLREFVAIDFGNTSQFYEDKDIDNYIIKFLQENNIQI